MPLEIHQIASPPPAQDPVTRPSTPPNADVIAAIARHHTAHKPPKLFPGRVIQVPLGPQPGPHIFADAVTHHGRGIARYKAHDQEGDQRYAKQRRDKLEQAPGRKV